MRNPYVKLVVILALIGVGGYFAVRYILSLPTKEERVFITLVRSFQRGDYDGMSRLTMGGSFFKVLDKSRILDTDGSEIDWHRNVGDWNEEVLEEAIKTSVRMRVTGLKFRSLSTQRLDGGAKAVVHFMFVFKVNDYTTGNVLAPDVFDGSAEGDCFVARSKDGSVLIERLDFTLVSIEGLSLKKYLQYM